MIWRQIQIRKQMADKNKQFVKAYDDFADAIFRYCFLRASSREAAQDITQETFVRAWNYLAEGNNINNFRPFLYKIATNLIIDEFRKKKPVSLDAMKEEGSDLRLTNDRDLNELIDAQDAARIMARLDGKYRKVVILRHLDGFSVKEIAEITQEPENVVSVRIHRGLRKLKEILNHG
ncbi:MAG: hypothetical protein A2667_00690 [Candidatus Wildermuthbacteria bacterium RIFCSPHIGHO2_01_FULL_47_27]|uniref:RNA polymerase sigma factor n=1 Tax=Candidatus Wildermuthbacteria bacterium RIFCSPHIGHO2_02_FULL_47_17 TaxID=1802452 RepID=A0A1G2R3D5_9BACT|nr:MAG: hypothetical protein A2667_00690 [Candidatus Wildermuthbacteria bacterium RIFCSPHIGHO2_01_FULL_47_27]OHA67394.1 MAG: hypothetical protein A3D59_01360 [Candidatus Wildermuthbacteria bacterium RIFCSPHIGHO2_02_FULL_47_17]OHA75542.1 MAG: hypothetical protein A3I38_03390 [Candidatus Wildermuthbacteria bacterium RIFCSPLOWO2_02_FULL_47_10]